MRFKGLASEVGIKGDMKKRMNVNNYEVIDEPSPPHNNIDEVGRDVLSKTGDEAKACNYTLGGCLKNIMRGLSNHYAYINDPDPVQRAKSEVPIDHLSTSVRNAIIDEKMTKHAVRKVTRRHGNKSKTLFQKKYWTIDDQEVYNVRYNTEGQENGESIIFSHPTLFKHLTTSKNLYIDATFRACAGLAPDYSQCLIIAARIESSGRSRFVPCVIAFMKSKKKKSYQNVFENIRLLCEGQNISAEVVTTDWESNIFSMFKKTFKLPNLQPRKCSVHRLRNVEKKMKKLKLWDVVIRKSNGINRMWQEFRQVSNIFEQVS